MAEEQSLPDDLDEIENLSKNEIEKLTTLELLDHIETVEKAILEDEGNFETREGQGLDYAFEWGDSVGSVGDNTHKMLGVLRERLNIPDRWKFEENQEITEEHDERLDGMQHAIDKLKKHGHGGQVEGDRVVYPD